MREDFIRTTERLKRLKMTVQSMAEVAYGQAEQTKQRAQHEWQQIRMAEHTAAETAASVIGTSEWELWRRYRVALASRGDAQAQLVTETSADARERQRVVEAAYVETQRWTMLMNKLEAERNYEVRRQAAREADEHALNRFGKDD